MCKGRRRSVPSGVPGAGINFWVCITDNRCCDRTKNKEKCAESF